MTHTDEDVVRRHATRFRRAIENTAFDDVAGLADFPHGSCHHACAMLAMFFDELQLGTWEQIGGHSGSRGCQHLWLEQDELIVDITASQFSDIHDDVIVSRESAWHAQWQRDDRKRIVFDAARCQEERSRWYGDKYARVLRNIDQESNDVAERRKTTEKSIQKTVDHLIQILQVTCNAADWRQYDECFFKAFRQSPADEGGIPSMTGCQVRDRIRDQLANRMDEYSRIQRTLDELSEAWSEWQFALRNWASTSCSPK